MSAEYREKNVSANVNRCRRFVSSGKANVNRYMNLYTRETSQEKRISSRKKLNQSARLHTGSAQEVFSAVSTAHEPVCVPSREGLGA